MRNTKLLSCFGAMALAIGVFSLPLSARAGNWSVNIGVPVVLAPAPAPAAVYNAPVVPVATVVQSAPVVYPYVSGFIVSGHSAPRYHRGKYHGHRGYHREHR